MHACDGRPRTYLGDKGCPWCVGDCDECIFLKYIFFIFIFYVNILKLYKKTLKNIF